MEHSDLNGLRKQLLLNGYKIIPNKYKEPVAKGWNTPDFIAREMTPERVEGWSGRFVAPSTGLLICDGLCVVDIDVDNPLAEDLLFEIERIAPQLASAPMRFGGGQYKVALFCRTEDSFVREASRKYNGHAVEVFGGGRFKSGNVSRQFGIYGPHSEGVNYSWAAETPDLTAIRAENLPLLSRAQALEICSEFEKLANAAGWKAEEKPKTEHSSAVYDIDETTRFNTNKGMVDYAALCDMQASYGDLRCASSFIPGRDGTNMSHCWVFWSDRHDCVAVFVHGDETTHYPVKFAPMPDRVLELIGKIVSIAQSKKEPPEPSNTTDINEKAEWLVQTRGYFEGEDSVVRLYDTSLDCRIKPSAFERRHKSWFVKEGTPARPRFLFATDLWSMTPQRINIAGVRMRPDRPFPTYEEDGQVYKNTYQRPSYAAGGDIAEFMTFMERFIPDGAEREWLFDWMAHKQMRPDIPGTSVFFVADTEEGVREGTFGTGRGLMFRIARQLYGPQYVRAQSFGMLDGSSGQSVFNDWLHGTVLVTVDESKTSPTAYRRGERSAAYEVLKELVDPAPKLHRFNGKNRQAFDGMSYCSIWVATNHGNAMAIPAHDRRFTILRNGREIRPEEVSAIVAWMDAEANIGALAEWLDARDISHFNMFQPLATVGKAEMAEMALSDVEEYLRDIMEDERRGLVFAKEHIEKALEHNFNGHGQVWRGEFKAAWHAYCAGLKGPTGLPRRVRMMGTQRKLFCFRDRLRVVKNMPEATIRREVAKWGGLDPSKGLLDIKGLSEIDETLQ